MKRRILYALFAATVVAGTVGAVVTTALSGVGIVDVVVLPSVVAVDVSSSEQPTVSTRRPSTKYGEFPRTTDRTPTTSIPILGRSPSPGIRTQRRWMKSHVNGACQSVPWDSNPEPMD